MSMKRNVGRPPKTPTGEKVALTLKLPSGVKAKLIADADAVGLTLTDYLIALIQRG
jgi:hypothetical protein